MSQRWTALLHYFLESAHQLLILEATLNIESNPCKKPIPERDSLTRLGRAPDG